MSEVVMKLSIIVFVLAGAAIMYIVLDLITILFKEDFDELDD